MKKKIMQGLIFLGLLLGIIGIRPEDVKAKTYTNEDGSYVYAYIDSKTKIAIYEYSGTKEEVTIPSEIENLPVAVIINTFNGNTTIKKVTIPSSVNKILSSSFKNCKNLETVKINGKITEIGDNAFNGCSKLSFVALSDSLELIGDNAFQDCTVLNGITIPDSVTSIGNAAFCGCTSLEKINISKKLTSLGTSAFKRCTAVKEINITGSFTEIPESAFSSCSALTRVTIGNNIEIIGRAAFSNCGSLIEVILPEKLKIIESKAFYNCNRIAELIIPDTIEKIGTSESDIVDTVPAETKIYLNAEIELAKVFENYNITYCPKLNISKLVVNIDTGYTYTGSKIEPSFSIIDTEGNKLEASYLMCSYSGNNTVGTGTITITGKGKYYGTVAKEFIINPSQVTGLKVSSQGAETLGLKWETVKGGVNGYQIMLKNSATGKYELIKTVTGNSGEISSLKPGMAYTFRVIAYKKIGTRTYKGAASAEYTAYTLPDAVTGLTFKSSTTGTVELQWKAPAAKIKGYEIYRYNTETKKYEKIATVTGTTYKNTGLTAGTKYKYKIRTYMSLGGKTYYSAYTDIVDAVTLPGTVKGLKQAEDSTSTAVRIKWDIIKGVSGYEVYRYSEATGTYKLVNTRKGSSTHSWTNQYLKSNTEYKYKVRAYVTMNGKNYYGGYSGVITTSTTTKMPTVKLSQTKSGQVTVNWDKVEGATGYIVYYRTSPAAEWKALTLSTYNKTTYTKSNLTKGKKYYFCVKAVKLYNGIKLKSGVTGKSITIQ